ncbi:MAG: hypothetical protein JOZ42_04175 [Acetobacteraceae bacterium]|nr:hypothetical protein [Acetobacteraceae bacterium]
MSARTERAPTVLIPLFLVSFSALGYEIALTRYFAVAKWSEYGYWVISIAMVGFALSGVVLALFRDACVQKAHWLLAALPALLVLAAALGFHFTALNPFNPLQLQNRATWVPQLWNIAGYYGCLLPFFFLTGTFVGLSFILNDRQIGRVYGYDLTGAGCGALAVLGLMYAVPPFHLVPCLLLPLAAAAVWTGGRWRTAAIAATLVALIAGEALLMFSNAASFNDFKAIYAPLHTPGARALATLTRPGGYYMLLDDFTERVDTDVSNNAGLLGVPGPPQTYGLYRDGNRIAALPKPGGAEAAYAGAALDAFPYRLLPHPRVLLAGASGGFRITEALALGASHVLALEPEPQLHRALAEGLGASPAFGPMPRVSIANESPLAAIRHSESVDLVDVSAEFIDTAEANGASLTAEAITAYLNRLGPGGVVSLPVSIRDFPVYALRMLATARAALLAAGIPDPTMHVAAYRSAWNVRILLSNEAWDAARIAALKSFCDDRSFDVVYYPGLDLSSPDRTIYNDLPAVSFDAGEMASGDADDAVADEAAAMLRGEPTPSQRAFDLSPVTMDRPAFYSVLRLDRLSTILKRLEILPQAEIGALVNLAVLAQAVVIAAIVLLIPLVAPRRIRAGAADPPGRVLRAMLYFPALGLGFLFIEIFAIEKASLLLGDRTSAFALVLTGMLIFSGLGSLYAARRADDPRRALSLALSVVVVWCFLVASALSPALLDALALPWMVRALLILAVIAPVSVALGVPFPLGLHHAGAGGFLPWAWALNGAFSVVATPLANLIAREQGFTAVLLSAAGIYVVAFLAFPSTRRRVGWQSLPAPSRAVD